MVSANQSRRVIRPQERRSLHACDLKELVTVVEGEIVAADKAAADYDLVVLCRLLENRAIGVALDLTPHLPIVEEDDEPPERCESHVGYGGCDAVHRGGSGLFLRVGRGQPVA